METKELRETVSSILSENDEHFDSIDARCHEIAFTIHDRLQQDNLPAELHHGVAIYDSLWLGQQHIGSMNIPDWLKEDLISELKPGKLKTMHSWVTVGEHTIDYNNSLGDGRASYETILFVRPTQEMGEHVDYRDIGKRFTFLGKTRIYVPLFYMFTLRTNSQSK